MRFLVAEKLGPHKFKTPEGYLICTDAILSRTGKQEYRRCEIFGDACDEPDKIVNVDRIDAEVFSDKAMASFENKPICIEHPDQDVNIENHNELSVGFIRDIHKGEDNGHPVMMGTLVITDKDAVEAVESGEYKELSCGYDCDIDDNDNPQQRNIRGNHVALCKQGRAGIARIVDSVDDADERQHIADAAVIMAGEHNDDGKYFYGYLSVDHPKLGNFYVSFKIKGRRREVQLDGTGWNFIKSKGYTTEQKRWIAQHKLELESVVNGTVNDSNTNDLEFSRMTEEAKKLKEELGMYARQAGSHKSTGVVPYKTRQSGSQVKELNEAINEAIQQLQNGVRDKSAWNRLAIKLEAWEDDPEMTSVAKRAAKAIRKFESFIGDSDIKDIQSTTTPGTDKIIYVMQSDVDKNLYFYIGKKFSMKEGAWGYTKFEMGDTTPEQLKAELSKNGWHTVSQGIARIIDGEHDVVTDEIMKDESRQTLIEKLRTVSVPYGERYALTSGSGWHIDIQHHGQASYENINKYPHASPKESSKATIRLWYNGKHMKTFEGPLNSAKSDAIRYLQTRTEDSWSSVEEENYNKANKPVGAKDETEKNFKIYVKNIFGAYKVADWPAVSKEAAVKEFLEMNPAYRNKGIIEARDSVSDSKKEQLFTIEYEQDGVMHVRKVRASSIDDAISKVKDADVFLPLKYSKTFFSEQRAKEFAAKLHKKYQIRAGKDNFGQNIWSVYWN